jgi:alpha-N-arabinofuranosidase
MAMYANKLEKRIGKVKVEAGKFSHDRTSVDVVDAIATVDSSGQRWAIALVNRHPTDRVACTLVMNGKPLDGTYKATVLTGASADSYNDIAYPNRVQPKEVSLVIRDGVANLPAHSLVIVNVAR